MKILKWWISQQTLGFILGTGILRPFLESEYLWFLLTEVGKSSANLEPMVSGVTGWDLEKEMKKIYSSLVPFDELFLNRFRTGEAVSALRARGISHRDRTGGQLLRQLWWKWGRVENHAQQWAWEMRLTLWWTNGTNKVYCPQKDHHLDSRHSDPSHLGEQRISPELEGAICPAMMTAPVTSAYFVTQPFL